jgi:hypothetical protein
MAEITLSHLEEDEGDKEPAIVEGIEEAVANRLAFREYRRRS